MEFFLAHVLLVPLCVLGLWLSASVLVTVMGDLLNRGALAERALAASFALFLALNLEVWVLSWVPLERPLDLLPFVHTLVFLPFWLRTRRMRPERRSFSRESWEALKADSPATRAICVILAGICLLYSAYGMYMGLGSVDELSYHGPQALALYQEGKLAGIESPLPWVDAYPRGAALVWGWSMFWTRADVLFHPLQVAFGVQFILGVFVLARGLGATRELALGSCLGVVLMPVFYRMSTFSTADMAYAAAVLGTLAFGMSLAGRSTDRLPWAFLAFAQAAAVKIPLVASWTLIVIVGWRLIERRRATFGDVSPAMLAAALAAVVFGCRTYLYNWVYYHNPLYPIDISVGGTAIFRGPVTFHGDIGASTTMGPLAGKNLAERYHAAWVDWFNPLSEDSFGGFGPVMIMAWLPLALGFMLTPGAAPRRFKALIAAVTLGWLLMPAYFLPRYSLSFAGLAAGIAAAYVAWIGAKGRGLWHTAMAVSAFGAVVIQHDLRAGYYWARENNGGQHLSVRRTTAVAERHLLPFASLYPGPELIRKIRQVCTDDTRLVWNVSAFQTLMWNLNYSNKNYFLAGVPADRYPLGAHHRVMPDALQLSEWLQELTKLEPTHVLVYDGTAYAEALDKPYSGFVRIFTQPEDESRLGMVLFEQEAAEG